jgi:hypothetical protein
MDNLDVFGLIFLALSALIWLLPLIIIFRSNKTSGSEKLGWIFAVIFISWFAWIFYLLFAPINKLSTK